MNSFLVVLEAAALLTARCNSNYLEDTSSLEAAALLTARFRSNTGLSTRRAGTRPVSYTHLTLPTKA